MASFRIAVELVLGVEGGYSNDPEDPGGGTNFGISKRSHPDEDIKNLTRDRAIQIYREVYWRYDWIPSQEVANKLFDMTVNMGTVVAHRYFQRSLEALGYPLVIDGFLGPKTAFATHSAIQAESPLMEQMRRQQIEHYCRIAKPRHRFLKGWLLERVAP